MNNEDSEVSYLVLLCVCDANIVDIWTLLKSLNPWPPSRLLYMYDHGGYHPLPPEFIGPRRIVGHFIDVEVARRPRIQRL